MIRFYPKSAQRDPKRRLTPVAKVGDRRAVLRRERALLVADADAKRRWREWAIDYGPLAMAVAFVAERTIAAILAKVGHAGATLDDSYIHFQYARAFAEGHPLRFHSGATITSGATSLLWPALLAPFWALGARDDAILWPAWGISFVALGALAWEASRLTARLAGALAATGAAAMTVTFGGFVWCAASGMEVVPFAWAIARTTRLSAEWSEAAPDARSTRGLAELVALAWVSALFRPEGGEAALFAGATLAAFPHRPNWSERAWGIAAASPVLAVPLLLWAVTGSPRSNTAAAKLLPGNPYYSGAALFEAVEANVKIFIGKLLNGEAWSAEFLPHGGAPLAMAGLAAIAVLGMRGGSRWRATGVLALATTMFAPCFYYTFLWNRLRYLWPFSTGWIVGLACMARLAGDVAGAIRPRWRLITGLACGVFVGLFVSKLAWVIDDAAQSASGIDRQQVALGRWARDNLDRGARIGVNDTGAIAYFGERATFDVVGLTTAGEARYWVSGAGSRFEHYERLRETEPTELPTHFIVYPEWMAMDAVLGVPMNEATVTDATILGGQTMRAYVADWSKLGSGERPWTLSLGDEIIDSVDVADLESEADHEYELLGAREGEQTAHEGVAPDGHSVVDGGRTQRWIDRFAVHLPSDADVRGIVRLSAPVGTRIEVLANGRLARSIDVGGADDEDWVERTFDVRAAAANERTTIELRAQVSPVTTFHYWFVRQPSKAPD